MSEETLAGFPANERQTGQSQWRLAWRTLLRHPIGMIGLVGTALILLMALAAPLIAPFDPIDPDYSALLQPPGADNWFGTDELGRDIFSRIVWGARETLKVGFAGMAVAVGGGVVLGLIAGYYGGIVDSLLMRLVDVWIAFPSFLLLLSIIAVLGPGLTTLIIALGISAIPTFGRVVRGSVLVAKNLEYVTAARIIGASNLRIMTRHILPNILGVIVVYATLGLGGYILLGAGLSFLGLGAQPPSPEWGTMLAQGFGRIRDAWWLSVYPGLAILVAVLCVNLLGDGLRDALDPKLQN